MIWPSVKRRLLAIDVFLITSLFMALLCIGPHIRGTDVAIAAGLPVGPGFNCTGTRFFGSAPAGTTFKVGDVWQGGQFTFIEKNNTMAVGNSVGGITVGSFPQPQRVGGVAQIEFDHTIRLVAILWFDNDPKQGEEGWSVNDISGPWITEKEWQWTLEDSTTRQIQINAGQDSGGVDFCFEEDSDAPEPPEHARLPNVPPEAETLPPPPTAATEPETPPLPPDLRDVPIPIVLPETGAEQRQIPGLVLTTLLLWGGAVVLHRTRL
jgi:hypothetical protein